MTSKISSKKAFLIMALVFISLIITIIAWGIVDYLHAGKLDSLGVLILGLIWGVLGFKMLWKKYESIRGGEPFKDERTRKIETKAAAYAFYIGIYWLLVLGVLIEYFQLPIPARSTPGVGLAGMAVIFGLAYWYFAKRGE